MGPLSERSADSARRGGAARLRRAALAASLALPLACLLLLALDVGGAQAVLAQLENGRAVSYQPPRGSPRTGGVLPFDQVLSNMEYNGGPIMPSNTNYAFYWDPAGGPTYPAGYTEGVDQYFTDLAHDSGGDENVDSVAAQYGDAEGEFANYASQFAGAIVDEQKYPPNGCARATICLTDEQIQAELRRYIAANGLPHDLKHEYFVITPPTVADCFEANGKECSVGSSKPVYCAYHTYVPLGGEGEIIYAFDPYVTENPECDDRNHPNGLSDGLLEGGLSHEHNESITDPLPGSGWIDLVHEPGENGDKCRTFRPASEFGAPLGTAPDGANYNQVINGHLYWYQQEWSNEGRACLQRLAAGSTRPIATFSSKAGGGTEMRFDATGSSAAGGVTHYDWQFGDGAEPAPVESSSPLMTHTFSSFGFHTVSLTVYGANGASGATARTILVGANGPTAAIEMSPAAPNPGQSISFDASSSTPGAGSIESYSWVFGDGSAPASGAKPSHSYGTVGDYVVTVTVTDSSGQTASLSRDVEIRNTQTVEITSPAPSGATAGGAPYTIAASASSGLPVTFTIAPESSHVCAVSGDTVSFTGAGTCTINANQGGSAAYFPATRQQSFTVGPGTQTITISSTPPSSATAGGLPYAVEASASSGLPVALTIAPQSSSVCTLSGAVVRFIGIGTCTIDANQEGNASFFPAAQVQQSFFVARGSQSISFSSPAPAPGTVGGAYVVEAQASSGLPVALSIAPESSMVCSLAGTTVSFLAVGTCTVDANQEGDESYFPASQAQQSFSVAPMHASTQSTTTSIASLTSTTTTTLATSTIVSTNGPPTPLSLIGRPKLNRAASALLWSARLASPGTVRWRLLFNNADVGFIDRFSRSLAAGAAGLIRTLAALARPRATSGQQAVGGSRASCPAGSVKRRGRCRRLQIPLAEGSQPAPAGQIEITVALNAKARSALRAGKTLHVSGAFSFAPLAGGAGVTDRVTAVLRAPRHSGRTKP
jgi:PKD repeat protein